MLCINSRVDETWQLLHHIRQLDNPFRVDQGLIGYLFSSWRAFTARAKEVSRLHGEQEYRDLSKVARFVARIPLVIIPVSAIVMSIFQLRLLLNPQEHISVGAGYAALIVVLTPLAIGLNWILIVYGIGIFLGAPFVSAALSPLRWMWRQARAAFDVPNSIGTYMVRRRGWSLAQEMLMGLEGYRYPLPNIDVVPVAAQTPLIQYEHLAESTEKRALANRDAWIGAHFGSLSQTFSKLVVTAADLATLLRAVENDLSLVHAAYYSDDDSIDRIARWIAGKG